jgi:predicted RNA-binding Zn-ribbon protein involved in translation (DUF1610 family)
MARVGLIPSAHLQRRMCLSCGYDGSSIQQDGHDGVFECPRCGSDLYARPPRSYAELEALSDSNPGTPLPDECLGVIQEECGGARWGLAARAAAVIAAASLGVLVLSIGIVLGASL